MALAQPDFRDYWQFMEIPVFWLEHCLLLIVPLYCVYSQRFCVLPANRDLTLASFSVIAVYHSLILSIACILTGKNLNYLFCPPLGPLEVFGTWYRPVMYVFCLFVTVFTRQILWGLTLKVMDQVRPPVMPKKIQ
jgi:hypothetical protein